MSTRSSDRYRTALETIAAARCIGSRISPGCVAASCVTCQARSALVSDVGDGITTDCPDCYGDPACGTCRGSGTVYDAS